MVPLPSHLPGDRRHPWTYTRGPVGFALPHTKGVILQLIYFCSINAKRVLFSVDNYIENCCFLSLLAFRIVWSVDVFNENWEAVPTSRGQC